MMAMGKIRPMRESEIGEVSELLRESYTWLGKCEGLSAKQVEFLITERGSVETIRRESREQKYLVSGDGAGLTGMIAISGDEITKPYVRPSCHRRGIGRKLFEVAEACIMAAGHDRVTLGSFPSAVPFYERMGMRVTGRKQGMDPLNDVTITLMEISIEGERETTRLGP
jgi:predicted N-acetyltransferase YhbS